MEVLTEEGEKQIDESIDENNNLRYIKDGYIVAKGNNIILYGEVDFNNINDISNIKRFNLINEDKSYIYSNLDWNTGEVLPSDNKISRYNCLDAVKWFKYCHLLLGKPKRIIVYKEKCKNMYGRTY